MASLVVGVTGHSPQSAGQVEHSSSSSHAPSPHTARQEGVEKVAADAATCHSDGRSWNHSHPGTPADEPTPIDLPTPALPPAFTLSLVSEDQSILVA